MTTYESYKESGVKWIGQIPSSWEVKSLRNFLRPFSIRNQADKQLLSVTREKGVIIRGAKGDDDNNNVIPEDLSGYKYVTPGDFVINKMKSWQGSYGVTDFEGIVSPAYLTYHLDFPNKRFFSIALRSRAYIPFFMQYSKGIRVDQWDLTSEAIKAIPFFLPTKGEQEAIVAYLDKVTGDIDRAIEAQQQMIDALNERKQIIITRAVTRGLNPDAPLRDSGIDWLGKIPAHWILTKVKYVTYNLDRLRKPITADQRSRNNPKYDYYGASGVIDRIDYYCVEDRVLLIGEDGANLKMRNLPLVYKTEGRFWVNNHAHILKERDGYDYDYLAFLLETGDYTNFITGSAQPKLTKANLGAFPIAVAPYKEQLKIVQFIKTMTAPIDDSLMKIKSMISLLQERKQIIINEVVTGKKKVI